MDEELKEQIFKILTEIPDENSWLDYKQIPYEQSRKADFIKDVCAFLNSSESYGKDKFIIIGIENLTHNKVGILATPMDDDAKYQELCDKIQPRPQVATGTIQFESLPFGYIHIHRNNKDRIYSIVEDYPKVKIQKEEQEQQIKSRVYASTAFIRKGSRNYRLNEYDRRSIYEKDQEIKKLENRDLFKYSSAPIDDEYKDTLKICALFGTWNEENDEEKQMISEIIGKEYNVWIKTLRNLLSQNSEYVALKNNKWKIENKEELIERYSEDYFLEDIKNFEATTLKIVMELDPKFELEADKRIMSNIVGKKMIYSKELKKSVLETFAYIKSISNKFINCEQEIKNSQWNIVRQVLQNSTWKSLATLNDYLPILAEINEHEYISQLNNIIKNRNDEVIKLFAEKEENITVTGYTYGLIWSLELIAWNQEYIMEVFDIFAKLGKYDEKVIDSMSRVLLPWYPQTKADINLRKATIEMVLKEYDDIGWKLLMKLMPNQQTYSFPTYKPKWNNIIEEDNIKTTNKELYEQYNEYIKLAIKYSKTNPERIIKLIQIMDDVPKDLFDLIYNKIVSKDIITISDDSKFIIWNEIENLISKHKKYSDTDWALPKEAIEILEKMAKTVKPIKNEICYKRLFNQNYWELFDNKGSHEEQELKLLAEQVKAINKLLETNINKVIKFAKTTKDPYRIGIALAELKLKKDDEKVIIKLLDKKDFLVAQGYVNRKFLKGKFNWLNSLELENVSTKGRVKLLTQLPNNKLVWKRVKELLGDKENCYWKEVDIRYVENDSEYDYPLEKLLQCNRATKSLELINMALYEKRFFSRNLSVEALNKALHNQDNMNYINVYHIKTIIKDLQENKYNSKELFKIEWSYLPILSNDDNYRPITIEKKLSEEPQVFNDIICFAYKAHNDNTNKENGNEKLALNAYRLLDIWKLVPGTDDKGFIDKAKLCTWFKKMKKLAEATDRLEVSLLNFGQVLYHSPKDKDDFWIDRNVAEILNEDGNETIRKGFSLEAYNSVGVVNLDREGTVWLNLEEKWKERANETEREYFRFARTLRDLAKQYHEQAEYEKNHYDY